MLAARDRLALQATFLPFVEEGVRRAWAGRASLEEIDGLAGRALRAAEITGSGRYLDAIVEMHTALAVPLAILHVATFESLVWRVRPGRERLATYVALLRQSREASVEEAFCLERLGAVLSRIAP
jgi:hypothetical protein